MRKRWVVIVALALAVAGPLGAVGPAAAHHIRGLPHYGYEENYPQNPTYEIQAQTGPFKVYLSAFEIYDTKEVDIAVYVHNEETQKAYAGDVDVSVSDGRTTTSGPGVPDPSNTFHVRWVYESEGTYQVEAAFYPEGGARRVTLPLKVGSSGRWLSTGAVLGGVAAGLVIFLLVVARIKGRRAAGEADSATRLEAGAARGGSA